MENFGTPIELNFKKSWSREKKEFIFFFSSKKLKLIGKENYSPTPECNNTPIDPKREIYSR